MITAKTSQKNTCERIVVTSASGKRYDLGNPESIFFRLRVFIYKIRRKLSRS